MGQGDNHNNPSDPNGWNVVKLQTPNKVYFVICKFIQITHHDFKSYAKSAHQQPHCHEMTQMYAYNYKQKGG